MYAIGNSAAYLPALLGGLGLVFFMPSIVGLIRGVEHLDTTADGSGYVPVRRGRAADDAVRYGQ